MNKTIKLYGIIFVIVMVLLALLMGTKKEVVNWSKNFNIKEKSPFGLYVFDQEAQGLFNQKLKKVRLSPYEYYQKKQPIQNILFIQHDTDQESMKKILSQVSKGSNLMFISDNFDSTLNDTLHVLKPRSFYYEEEYGVLQLNDKQRPNKVETDKMPGLIGFYEVPKESELLGTFSGDENDDEFANFIKIPHGKGFIYYHSEPLFLTNYHFLKKNDYKYAQDVFSYLPNIETVWFLEKEETEDLALSGNTLGFILKHPALKYAWWIFLASLILLMIFRAKRTQRIIPVIIPKKNKTVEFVKSIGNLYLQEGDIADMMKKKTQYFLHHVRTEFFIDTKSLDEKFIKKLHLKTGALVEDINALILLINKSDKEYAEVNKIDLLKLDQIIDAILKK